MHVLTLPEYKEQSNQKRLCAEAPWERFTSGSQVTTYQHAPLWQDARCKISMDLFVCLCICVYEWERPSFFFQELFFSFFENQDSSTSKLFNPNLSQRRCRRWREGRKWSIAALPFWEETGKGWGSEIQEPAPLEQWKSHFNRKRICVKEGRQILLEGSGCDPGRGRDERDAVPNNSLLKPHSLTTGWIVLCWSQVNT